MTDVGIPSGGTMRQVQYFIPGGNESFVILTYGSKLETFPQYEARFDGAAKATLGAAAPRRIGIDWSRASRTGAYAAVAAGLLSFLVQLVRSRRAPKPPPRRMPTRRVPPRR